MQKSDINQQTEINNSQILPFQIQLSKYIFNMFMFIHSHVPYNTAGVQNQDLV